MRFTGILCLLLFSANAAAATVTVSVSQNSDAPSNALEMTRIIESEIMSEYFNSGEIVSNTQIVEEALSSSRRRSLIREAAMGMSDFLLFVYLEYDPNKKIVADSGGVYASLVKAEWQVISVPSSQVLGNGSLEIKESEIHRRNPNENARAAARMISREGLKVQHEAGRKK